MRQAYAYFVAALVCVAAVGGCGSPLPFDSVCQINTPNCSGSGALIAVNGNQGLVLTCRHVAQEIDTEVELLWLGTGEVTKGIVIDIVPGKEFNNDLALVACVRPKGITPVEVALFKPENGPFYTLGYRRREMYLSIATNAEESGGLIKLSAPLIGGISGGPTCDRFGRVVGVGVGTAKLEPWAVAADGNFLSELLEKYRD